MCIHSDLIFVYLTLFHVIIVNRFGCVAQFSSSVMVETILSVIIVLQKSTNENTVFIKYNFIWNVFWVRWHNLYSNILWLEG